MSYLSVIKTDGQRITAYNVFDNEQDALSDAAEQSGFVVPHPGGDASQWRVNGQTITVVQEVSILAQIRALEASVTPRRIREAIRGSGKAWLDSIDDQIAALRAQL